MFAAVCDGERVDEAVDISLPVEEMAIGGEGRNRSDLVGEMKGLMAPTSKMSSGETRW